MTSQSALHPRTSAGTVSRVFFRREKMGLLWFGFALCRGWRCIPPPLEWVGLFDVFFTKISLALPAELTPSPARVPSLPKGRLRNPVLLCAPAACCVRARRARAAWAGPPPRVSGEVRRRGSWAGPALHSVVNEALWVQFSPGTWWCHEGGASLFPFHLVAPQHRSGL